MSTPTLVLLLLLAVVSGGALIFFTAETIVGKPRLVAAVVSLGWLLFAGLLMFLLA